MKNKDQGSWGGAPIYYIRLNYDPDAEKLTLLDQPIIIPFTVKSELPVPNLRYEIDKDRRLTLVWDKVEGATEYKIYERSDLTNFDTNVPLTGAEDAFSNSLPLDIAVTTETSFNDFMKDGKGGLGTYNELITSIRTMVYEENITSLQSAEAKNPILAEVSLQLRLLPSCQQL